MIFISHTYFNIFIVGDNLRCKGIVADYGFVLDTGEDDAALAARGARAGRTRTAARTCWRHCHGSTRWTCTRIARDARDARAECDIIIRLYMHLNR